MAPSAVAVQARFHDNANPHRVAIAEERGSLTSRARLRRDFAEARAAKARYDLPAVLSLATDCRDRALKMHKMQPARVCDELIYGIAQRVGDARLMVEADYWWQQHGFAVADKNSNVYSTFRKANLARLIKTVPAFWVTVADRPSVLRYQDRIEFSGRLAAESVASRRPTVAANINGKPVEVLVDTGTALPLMMDRAHAKVLGATPLLDGSVAPDIGEGPRTVADGLSTDMITSFKVGGLVMHNVAATIVPDGRLRIGVLVGLPVLARFGRVDLDDARIVTGAVARRCPNEMPLRFAGAGQLGFSINANGRPAIAMVDTGSMYALYDKQVAGPNFLAASKTSPRPSPDMLPARHRRVRVQMGTWSMLGIDMPDANITLPSGIDVSIGAPLLTFADVRIDFSKPSLCVTPKPFVEHGAVFMYRDGRRESSLNSIPGASALKRVQ